MLQSSKSLGLFYIDSGGGAGQITGTVTTYGDLPAASSVSGKFYLVTTGSGVYLINRKPAGLYYSDGASWSSAPDLPTYFNDTNFQMFNNANNSKLLEWDLSSITASTTRTITMADANVDLADIATNIANVVEDTTPQLGGNLDVNGNSISGFTASRAMETDGSGLLQVSAITSAELAWLDGVSSSIQDQLNGKLADQTIGIADDNLLEVDGSPNSAEYARFTAAGLEGRTESEFKGDFNLQIGTDVLAQQTIGIADNNLLEVDGSPNSAEYARFTATGLEGRTEAEFKGDFSLTIGTDVLAEQTIGIANDNLMEVDGTPNSGEYARFTANGLEGRTEVEFKSDYSLVIGTDVLAEQTIGIANDNLLEVDDSPNDDEICRFTAAGIEGRTNAEMKTQLGYLTDLVDDTTPQLGGDLDCQANSVGFTQQTVTYNSGTTTVDWGAGNKAKMTFGAGNITTFAFTNPSKPGNFLLIVKQDGTGSRVVTTWDADVMWPSGTAPTLSTGVNDVDVISFYFDGTNYFGVASLDFS